MAHAAGAESARRHAQHGADCRLRARAFARDSGIIATAFSIRTKIPRAQEILGEERPVHTAEHLASAMFWLGVPRNADSAGEAVRRAIWPRFAAALRGDSSVCVGAGEDLAGGAICRNCAAACRTEPVFLAGPDDDASAVPRFSSVRERAARATSRA